jgi:hypothetical protein
LEEDKRHPVRYIAVRGTREIARNKDLNDIIANVVRLEEGKCGGFSDVVIWDLGTPDFPMMSVVASTCRGWISVNVSNRKYPSDSFGVSFTVKESTVLKQFFDIWTLAGGQSVSDAIKNIYEQSYVKDFKPGPGQIRLSRDEFKIFVNKLLNVVSGGG